MIKRRYLLTRSLSVGLAVLSLTLSIAVPALERGEIVGDLAVESGHDPTRCGHAHDHRICAQVGANLSVVSATHDYRLAHVIVQLAKPIQLGSALLNTFFQGPRSRAPPLV
jgi:hypothetical protein